MKTKQNINNETPKDINHPNNQRTKKQDIHLGAAINLAIQLDSAFRLYSFRIIDHQAYIDRVGELIGAYSKTLHDDLL